MKKEQEIEKWVVLQEVQESKIIQVVYDNETTEILLDENKDKLYSLIDENFNSAYIENEDNRMFIDKIYLNLVDKDNIIIEIIE